LNSLGRAIGLFALIGFCATLLIHIAALFGIVLLEFWELMPLMYCMAFVCLAAGLRIAAGRQLGLPPVAWRAQSRLLLVLVALAVAYALVQLAWALHAPRSDWIASLRAFSATLLALFLFPVLVFLRPKD